MGIIKASIEYTQAINRVLDSLNELEKNVFLSITDQTTLENFTRRLNSLRQDVIWLMEDKEALFEAVDRTLEDR